MKLTVNIEGERVKPSTYTYANPQNEPYTVADGAIEGTTAFVAATLRALADSLDGGAQSNATQKLVLR